MMLPAPRLALYDPFRMLEVNGRRLLARVHTDGSRVQWLTVLGLDLEAVAGKGEPMSDNVIGCFAVAFRLCCNPRPFQLLQRLGQCAMESFFSSLKTERTARKLYRTRDEAKADVFDYIERFYNPKRRHSTIGYLSPVEFESRMKLAWDAVNQTGCRPA
jgi:hypothetical protein